jgi:hypothetical protein
MSRDFLACLFGLLSCSACMTTTSRYLTRSVGQEETILESGQTLPAVMGDFTFEQGVVRGHVGWTYDCRNVVVKKQIREEIQVKRPNYNAAVAASVLGAGLGALSVGILSSLDSFSDEQTCSTDSDGHYSCSSPRDAALGLGAAGMISSLALVGAGVVTFGSKTTASIASTEPAEPVVSRIQEGKVACGSRPILGLGLSLFRAGERVAASTTNAEGEVAFAVPANVTGGLVVTVDAVPAPISIVRVGDIVGSVQVEPTVQAPTP